MSEHDWRAMLKAIIDEGNPIIEYGIDHEKSCQYCNEWSGYNHNSQHGETCAWRIAEEALIDDA